MKIIVYDVLDRQGFSYERRMPLPANQDATEYFRMFRKRVKKISRAKLSFVRVETLPESLREK
jgi:hypothetical protein